MDRSLRRSEILRRKVDIERVLFRGRRLKDGPVALYYAPHPAPGSRPQASSRNPARVAFITAGKFRTNVLRNRVKRRLREIYRTNKSRFPTGLDFILRGDAAGSGMASSLLQERIVGLAERVVVL